VLGAGFATHPVPSDQVDALVTALIEADWPDDVSEGENGTGAVVDAVLERFSTPPEPGVLEAKRALIDRCFAQETVEDIFAALEREEDPWAAETLETLGKRCPTSLKITFAQLRRGQGMRFDDILVMEYRMSQHCMANTEFYEGIRSVLVDKDHAPKWSPARIEDVDTSLVDRHFEPLGARDLRFD